MDSLTLELAQAAARREHRPQDWEQRFVELFEAGLLRMRRPQGAELTLQIRPEVSANDPAIAADHCLRYLEPALREGCVAGIDLSAVPAENFSDWLQVFSTALEGAVAAGEQGSGRMLFSLCTAHPGVAEFLQLRGRRALGYPALALRFDHATVRHKNPGWKTLVAISHADQRLNLVPRRIFHSASQASPAETGQCVMPVSLFETRPGAAWFSMELDASCAYRNPALRTQLAHCIRFADNLIDVQRWPLTVQHLDALLNRRVSFHVIHIGNMITNSGRDPASFKTLRWLQRWLRIVRCCLLRASNQLAIDRGPYPAFGAEELFTSLAPRYGIADASRIVRTRSVRHRHILALSPFAFFPDEQCDSAAEKWLNLLPALSCADTVTMYGEDRRSSLRLGSWSRLLQMTGAVVAGGSFYSQYRRA